MLNPFEAKRTAFTSIHTEIGVISAANVAFSYQYASSHDLTNSYDGFSFLSGANINATIRVYGYKD